MKVLIAHNAYQQRGGEDAVVEAEAALLQAHGHAVTLYRRDNHELSGMGKMRAAMDTVWSRQTGEDIARLVARDRPDVLHVHNTLALISPSIYWAAARAGVPVVQTLHNFRLLCPQALLLREGKVCELCVGKAPLAGIRHGCYRGSRSQTAVLTSMLMMHRAIGTWSHKVARYIALNDFCRDKFIEGGLPAERIVVKPNFVDFAPPPPVERSGFLFVGRLAPEKGIAVLARAVRELSGCELAVAGTGPDEVLLEGAGALLLGALARDEVCKRMCGATALLFPSIWYETFGLVAIEAFACGTPVIASRIGVIPDIVQDGRNGLLFEPGNADDLAEKMCWARDNPEAMAAMGNNARADYEAKFTPDRNYKKLIAIYEDVLQEQAVAARLP